MTGLGEADSTAGGGSGREGGVPSGGSSQNSRWGSQRNQTMLAFAPLEATCLTAQLLLSFQSQFHMMGGACVVGQR